MFLCQTWLSLYSRARPLTDDASSERTLSKQLIPEPSIPTSCRSAILPNLAAIRRTTSPRPTPLYVCLQESYCGRAIFLTYTRASGGCDGDIFGCCKIFSSITNISPHLRYIFCNGKLASTLMGHLMHRCYPKGGDSAASEREKNLVIALSHFGWLRALGRPPDLFLKTA